MLEDIESLLSAKNKKVVIFLDEFQDILKTEKTDLLQAELRDFAQRAQHVTFVISGSHRHMLTKIVDDKNKPFYKLCNRINLERIKSKDYEEFLQKHAQKQWGNQLPKEALDAILELTENHPYYINRLCARLWNQKLIEKQDDVQAAWKIISEEEYDSVVNEISLLSKNQRLVLQAFSQKEYISEPNSATFLNESKLAQSSVRQALGFLLKNDFIENTAQGYRVIDPLIKYILNQVSPEKLGFEQ